MMLPKADSASPSRSCKRVRFEEDTDRRVKRRVLEYLPLSSELPNCLKKELWLCREQSRAIRREAKAQASMIRKFDDLMLLQGLPHFSFANTYANVYTVCINHLSEESLTPEVLTFMASTDGSRGLEYQICPQVALQRYISRSQAIKLIVEIQTKLKSDPEAVRLVCETMSAPSKRFAEALGFVDATAAAIANCEHVPTPLLVDSTNAVDASVCDEVQRQRSTKILVQEW
jgi:hypothetical protein